MPRQRAHGSYAVVPSAWEQPRGERGKAKSLRSRDARRGGTTPRERGKHGGGNSLVNPVGNNPAYAGNSKIRDQLKRLAREQPRVRGEKGGGRAKNHRLVGTTPHMRGKENVDDDTAAPQRNNPAYAGKAGASRNLLNWRWNNPAYAGKGHATHAQYRSPGINPAYAGLFR